MASRPSLSTVLVSRLQGSRAVDVLPISSGGASIIAVNIIMITLATLWTAMRVWARWNRRLSPFLTEDIICYLALFFEYVFAINCILLVILGGSGQHIDTLSDEQLGIFYQLSFAAQFSYALAIGLVKLSITWTLKRIFDVPSVKIASFVIMGCSIAWMLQTIGVAIFLCQPTSLYWNPDVKGNCGNSTVAFTSVSVVDILVDGMILVLPMRPLSKLQVSKAHKIALFTIFGSVVITVLLTAVRVYIVYNVDFTDLTYADVGSNIISSIQSGLTIMIASSPLLRPVFDRTVAPWFGLSLRTTLVRTGERSTAAQNRQSLESRLNFARHPSRRFEQISDSERDLEWEMMGVKDRGIGCQTAVQASRKPPDKSIEGILVTETTTTTG